MKPLVQYNPPERPGPSRGFLGIDTPLLVIALLALISGSALIASVLYGSPGAWDIGVRHLIGLSIGLALGFFFIFVPHDTIRDLSGPLYMISLMTLVLVLLFGKTIHGSKSWLVFGSFNFQPTELAKMATVLLTSVFYARKLEKTPYLSGAEKLKLLACIFIPMTLVLAQNDFSSSLSFLFLAFVYCWVLDITRPLLLIGLVVYGLFVFLLFLLHIIAGLKMAGISHLSHRLEMLGFGPGMNFSRWSVWFGGCFVFSYLLLGLLKSLFLLPRKTPMRLTFGLGLVLSLGLVISWMGFKALRTYQKARVVSFLLPYADPLDSGYHILQSKIAVGSGGVLGRGILLGSQAALGFLPERHTDFIFAALAEQVGFVGSLGVIILFGALFWRLCKFVHLARDPFGRLVAVGFLALWSAEVCLNLACVLGILPILGIGLPFLSYGSSRLIMNVVSVGILLSISRDFYVYR